MLERKPREDPEKTIAQGSLAHTYDAFLFDLDGVIYAGAGAIAGAPESIQTLARAKKAVGYVTNNASRSAQEVSRHLTSLNVPATEETVFGSAPLAVEMLMSRLNAGAHVLVVGSPSLAELVALAGGRPLKAQDAQNGERIDAVIQGFDPNVAWTDLAQASYAISHGALWIATNTDETIPRAEGIAPGNGTLVAAVARATGKLPLVAGKPEPHLFRSAAEHLGANNPLVIGDRMDTDIAGGRAAGFATALVLTGIDDALAAENAPEEMRPDYVITSLTDLFCEDYASKKTGSAHNKRTLPAHGDA